MLVIRMTPPDDRVRKLMPRTFANLIKAGYFPSDRWLKPYENGDFITNLTTEEHKKFCAMVGTQSVWIRSRTAEGDE